MQPCDSISSQNGGPFAFKCLSSSVIAGKSFSQFERKTCSKQSSFFVTTKTPNICEMYSDLRGSQRVAMSVKDRRFLNHVMTLSSWRTKIMTKLLCSRRMHSCQSLLILTSQSKDWYLYGENFYKNLIFTTMCSLSIKWWLTDTRKKHLCAQVMKIICDAYLIMVFTTQPSRKKFE